MSEQTTAGMDTGILIRAYRASVELQGALDQYFAEDGPAVILSACDSYIDICIEHHSMKWEVWHHDGTSSTDTLGLSNEDLMGLAIASILGEHGVKCDKTT